MTSIITLVAVSLRALAELEEISKSDVFKDMGVSVFPWLHRPMSQSG
jgi:hypothetical protein